MGQIESLLQRPKAYYNIDGVGELGAGFMLLGYALLLWLQTNSPATAIWHRLDVFYVWVGLMLLVLHYGTKAIREQVTYRRTGFVELKKRKSLWPVAFALGSVIALAGWGVAMAARSPWETGRPRWGVTTAAALAGVLFAVVYAYGIARYVRWKWAVAATIAISSIVIAMLPAEIPEAVGGGVHGGTIFPARIVGTCLLFLLVVGALLMLSGAGSFVLYLRHTQPPEQTAG